MRISGLRLIFNNEEKTQWKRKGFRHYYNVFLNILAKIVVFPSAINYYGKELFIESVFREDGRFIMVRLMTIEDYDQVRALWMTIKGFAIRSIDDSREGVARFLRRNPTTSVVAVEDEKVVVAILCGHDGRRGCLYHVCVHPAYRRRCIGKEMVIFCM